MDLLNKCGDQHSGEPMRSKIKLVEFASSKDSYLVKDGERNGIKVVGLTEDVDYFSEKGEEMSRKAFVKT